jgi:AraC-like DNA-binding protein
MVAESVLSPDDPVACDRSDALRAYECFCARSPEAAETKSSALLAPHRLSVERDRARFWAFGHFAVAGGATVCQMSFGSEVTIDRPGEARYLAILAPTSGYIDFRYRGHQHTVSAGHSLAVLSPADRVTMRWSRGSEVFALLLDTHALGVALKMLAPHADDRPLRFRVPVLGFRSAAPVYGAARLLADVFSQYPSAAEIPRQITRPLADQALNTVLLSVENNHSDELRRPAQPCRLASVNTAIELVDAETYATHSIADLARHSEVTVRALELAFRKALDVTPHAFLQRSRLAKAHCELQAANPGDSVTVTEVAARWGFGHAGRFAARYREVYGVMPSETLRLTGTHPTAISD